ncbi:hemerythrin domain-containing protein [Clostridium bovifaecis]|uniref:Hemerythrin domain-containing protein n=1 Tax=Clostridium bovifaecis TaxID=2184719 RepID=A0A6I6EQ90_9CLOT|nr:hemerythrin domain-containing protein [Clostridium bovifaecis]
MGSVLNLKRQHIEIGELIESINKLIKQNNIENDANEIAKNINILSGKVKIHLDSEDKFLYPDLLREGNDKIKSISKSYVNEMGNIAAVFMDYKNRFNTKSKILGNTDGFKKETCNVLKVLTNRLQKEDRELYPLISE